MEEMSKKEKKYAHWKRWFEKNKEARRANRRDWGARNREVLNAKARGRRSTEEGRKRQAEKNRRRKENPEFAAKDKETRRRWYERKMLAANPNWTPKQKKEKQVRVCRHCETTPIPFPSRKQYCDDPKCVASRVADRDGMAKKYSGIVKICPVCGDSFLPLLSEGPKVFRKACDDDCHKERYRQMKRMAEKKQEKKERAAAHQAKIQQIFFKGKKLIDNLEIQQGENNESEAVANGNQ